MTAASIRRQLDLMAEVRDRVAVEPDGAFEEWMDALVPLTERLIRDLHTEECKLAGIPENPWHRIHGHDVAWKIA